MSKLKKILTMENAKVEYVYEDENGQEFTAEEQQITEADLLEQQGEVQEIMIVEHHSENQELGENKPSLLHAENADRDPDCKRGDNHHCWGIQQSIKLIETMKKFKNELANTSNRRGVWTQIHEDVCNKGLAVSVQECQNKWKNLIRTYKECCKMRNKDNMRFRYYKEMADYFGGETFAGDHDYNKSKLHLFPLTKSVNQAGASSSHGAPTVTFPPICFTDRQFIEYTNMKREEYAARQKRHEEEMALRKMELDIQKKKLEVMKKAAMASVQGSKAINFGNKKRKYPKSDNNSSIEEVETVQVVQQTPVNNFQILADLAF
ncbi:uncharacterized protein LOC126739948 isoform X2 [Anthonomus grandis grandis]|uniref:uncharacterized protein LOC126739948 isoform X2 n=1 Tax=Anthonomus grandis grandis TaxID=2921223 RepID=UPI0021659F6C|nr:uncharacterized protein LOC126739948 isoform X2 [Anthonomus grandis grandis]